MAGWRQAIELALSEEDIDEDASDGFLVGQADGAGCMGRCCAYGAATDD
jgi:hypothetical protein